MTVENGDTYQSSLQVIALQLVILDVNGMRSQVHGGILCFDPHV